MSKWKMREPITMHLDLGEKYRLVLMALVDKWHLSIRADINGEIFEQTIYKAKDCNEKLTRKKMTDAQQWARQQGEAALRSAYGSIEFADTSDWIVCELSTMSRKLGETCELILFSHPDKWELTVSTRLNGGTLTRTFYRDRNADKKLTEKEIIIIRQWAELQAETVLRPISDSITAALAELSETHKNSLPH